MNWIIENWKILSIVIIINIIAFLLLLQDRYSIILLIIGIIFLVLLIFNHFNSPPQKKMFCCYYKKGLYLSVISILWIALGLINGIILIFNWNVYSKNHWQFRLMYSLFCIVLGFIYSYRFKLILDHNLIIYKGKILKVSKISSIVINDYIINFYYDHMPRKIDLKEFEEIEKIKDYFIKINTNNVA